MSLLLVVSLLPGLVLASNSARGAEETDAAAADRLPDQPGDGPAFLWEAGRVETQIRVEVDSLRQALPHGWIRPESFRLTWGDTLYVRGVDYLLDPRRGTLRFLRSFPDSAALDVSYRFFPVALRGEYLRHRPEPAGDLPPEPAEQGPAEDSGPPGEPGARLDISGSKTFSVEVGSRQDLAVEQSLDLAASGRVGRDVEVRAILTDRDTPLQPEGTSAQLEDLDRILVEVEGPRAAATLGDFEMTLPPSEFAQVRRQLEGVRGDASPGPLGLFGTGATTPGTLFQTEFFGQEGKQGPYALRPAGAQEIGVIVAGSERVWLDGRPLRRGEGEDYIIDYSQATISFTGRNVITAYSEIAVDFQYAQERYRRSLYAGGAGWGGPAWRRGAVVPDSSRLEVRALFLTEADDKDRPLIPLTASQKEALREAGDSLTEGLQSGIIFVGRGGDYDKVENDSLAVPFYLFAGRGEGSYLVRFEDVGNGEGDYSDSTTTDGFRYYLYQGRKKGRFVPGDAVPRPERTSMVSFVSQARPADRMVISAEVALSDHDANTFSSRDDGDNQGAALLLQNEIGPLAAGPLALSAGGSFRQVDSRFRSLDRLDPSFFNQDWNVDRSRLEEGDRRRSLFTRLGWRSGHLRLEVGDLDNWTDYRGQRGRLEALAGFGPLRFTGRALRVRSHDRSGGPEIRGARAGEDATLAWPGAWTSLSVGYSREQSERGTDDDRSGSLFREGRLRLGTGSRFRALQAGLEYQRRVRWILAGTAQRRLDVGHTGLLEMDWTRGRGRRVEAEAGIRELRPEGEGVRQSSRLGRILWTERRGDDAWIQEGRWELSTSEEGFREKDVRFVGENAGHYDSLGVYTGVGDYEVYYLEAADSTRLNRIDFSLRNELDLSRLDLSGPEQEGAGSRRWVEVLRTLRLVHYWTARLETERSAGYLWENMPAGLWGSKPLPLAETRMRVDLSVLPGARWASPRLRQERERRYQGILTNSREESQRSLWALRLRSRPGDRWTADQEMEWESTKSQVVLVGQGGRTDGWRSLRVRLDQQVSLSGGITAGFDLSGRYRERLRVGETAQVFEGTPSLVWSPRPRSRVEARTTRTSLSRRGGTGSAPRDLEVPGWVSRIVATVRLRGSVDLSLWAQDRQPDHGPVVRDLRMEVRATF